MTPREFRDARRQLGLTQSQLATALGLGKDGARTVRKWEAETGSSARPPNPIACRALHWMLQGFRPPEWPHQ